MNIKLPPEQQKWQTQAGEFASVDEAVALAVADPMLISDDDLAWAKP